jgi:hypothetical protein
VVESAEVVQAPGYGCAWLLLLLPLCLSWAAWPELEGVGLEALALEDHPLELAHGRVRRVHTIQPDAVTIRALHLDLPRPLQRHRLLMFRHKKFSIFYLYIIFF